MLGVTVAVGVIAVGDTADGAWVLGRLRLAQQSAAHGFTLLRLRTRYSYGYAPAYSYGYAPGYNYGYRRAYYGYAPSYNYGYAPGYNYGYGRPYYGYAPRLYGYAPGLY